MLIFIFMSSLRIDLQHENTFILLALNVSILPLSYSMADAIFDTTLLIIF